MIGWIALALVLARWGASVWLTELNRSNVRVNAASLPPAFAGVVDGPTYERSVAYTLARNRLAQLAVTYGSLVVLAALFSGILPVAYDWFVGALGSGVWAMAAYLLTVGLSLSVVGLPVGWYSQFGVEERFGFNTSTQRIWWLDVAKRLLLALVLGHPLIVLVLGIVERTGSLWWLWAWGAAMGYQLLVTVLAPVLILPLFNKLTPLPEGSLSERLTALAERTSFAARSIQVMDGSKRSLHSNAFFTGFGRLRRIVLFDTLVDQMEEPEIEAVLAHEIGHSKRKHVLKLTAASALGSLAGLAAVAWVAVRPEFVEAFGFTALPPDEFSAAGVAPVLLLFGLLAGSVGFWLSPLANALSRRYEYEADAYALETIGEPGPMVGALRKLTEKNLSNLTPHPLYSRWHYSHPTLLEREAALRSQG